MPGVIPNVRDPDRTPVVPAWYCAGVVGPCGWRASDGDRVAEHARAADRFAREIVGFFNVIPCSALAAADGQHVGRFPSQSGLDLEGGFVVLRLTNAVRPRNDESRVVWRLVVLGLVPFNAVSSRRR